MADEEDVVFVNSPLFEHLAEVGFTDFDAKCFNDVPEQVGRDIGAYTHLESSQDPRNRYLTKRLLALVDFLRKICGVIWSFVVISTKAKEIECHSSYLSLIKASKLLTEDDEEFIFRFEKCISSETVEHATTLPSKPHSGTVAERKKQSWLTFLNSNIIIGLVVLLTIILGYYTTDDRMGRHLSWINTALFICLVVFLCICTCKICFIWWNIKIDHLHDHNLLLLRNYFEAMERLFVLSRKSILHIQEKELLARGHIIISPMVPIARIESNSVGHRKIIKHCIMLRKCIFSELEDYLGILQKETKALSSLSLFENSKLFNWFDKHVLRIDTELLNTGLDVNTETNEFSLVLLKRIVRCLVVQQSLLLCYVSLMLLFIVADKNQSYKKENHLAIIKNCFECLLEDVNKHSHKIEQCYRFHRAGTPYNVQHEAKIKADLSGRFASTFSPFSMAVHSMNLHLQEASKKSLSIEEKLDEIDSKTTSVEEFVVQHFDEVENELMCMKRDLNNLTSCWDECHNRLCNLNFIVHNDQKKERWIEEKACDNHRDQIKDDVQILSITGDGVVVVPDQVFEGETFSQLDDDQNCSSTLDSEELFERKVKEENSYLLQELKSVLATKDCKAMVGLPRALLSKKHGSESTSIVDTQAIDMLQNITSRDVELLEHSTCMDTPECHKHQSGNVTSRDGELLEHSTCMDTPECHKHQSGSDKAKESIDKYNYHNHSSSQSMLAETDGNLEIDAVGERAGAVDPFVSMIAAAALARNKEFGFKEQRYEIDGQAETVGADKAQKLEF